MTSRITIATWIVLDDPNTATAFPSSGSNSAAPDFQMVYWRCISIYFLTSRVHNPDVSLVLYANVDPNDAAPPKISALLRALGVVFRKVDISFRLPRGSVDRFGNQFYVLDVINDFVQRDDSEALVLTDSDCIWRRPIAELEIALFTHECLLYTLAAADQKGYEAGQLMNGMTHARMSAISRQQFGLPSDHQVQYHGGEFFAATRVFCRRMQSSIVDLWQIAYEEAAQPDSIKEEAHFLSILLEGMGVPPSTANPFVRRIWSNFEDANAVKADSNLTIWHLPAEKRYGFRRLWLFMERRTGDWKLYSPEQLNRLTARYMGIPRRGFGKLVLDIAQKLHERAFRV